MAALYSEKVRLDDLAAKELNYTDLTKPVFTVSISPILRLMR